MTLADFNFFLDGPIEDSGFRTYRFPSGRGCDLLPTPNGWALAHGDGTGQHGMTEVEVVEQLARLAAAPALAA